MKQFKSFIALLVLISACTPKKLENNTHDEAPVYEQSVNLSTKEVKSITEVEALFTQLYPEVKSGDSTRLITAIGQMEVYVLNLENMENPAIHFEGKLAPSYRKLMDLYGYALSLGISRELNDETFLNQLKSYRSTIFSSCHLDNQDCRSVAPFKGTYGVTILNHLLSQDIDRLEKQTEIPQFQQVKNVIFGLYVLKNFREAHSNVTGDLFIRFSSTFFRAIKINSTEEGDQQLKTAFLNDTLLKTYLLDLQNQMVKQSQQEVSASSCSIFDSIDPLLLTEINSNLQPSFVSQLTSHFYKCNTPEEINRRIVEIEKTKKDEAEKNIKENGFWEKNHGDFHSRAYILRKETPKVLRNYGISGEIPLNKIYFLDRIFYGKVGVAEKSALLDRFTQEELIEFVDFTEQFAQENFLYAMNYTFNVFNRALTVNYQKNGGVIDKDFVQNVYDSLWERTGDTWVDYKESVTRLKISLGDVFVRLNPENRSKYREKINLLRDKKLEKIAIDRLINLSVTYPIVLATNYIVGKDGGGTMKIRVSWLDWLDNSIEISTANPLRDYFTIFKRINLQLLDFGYLSYSPNELEKSTGLNVAIRTGFFDIVNLDVGNENKGTLHNLTLFFKEYVKQNEEWATHGTNEIEEIQKIQDNHWPKVKRLCKNPISAEKKILLSSVYQDFILHTSEAKAVLGKTDLSYVDNVRGLNNSIRNLQQEIDKIKRTYQVIMISLKEVGLNNTEFKKSLDMMILPHFKVYRDVINTQKKLLEDIGGNKYTCLKQLEKLQRYQQNQLQRNTVKYLAKVHSAMNMIRKAGVSSGDTALVVSQKIQNYANESEDSFAVELAQEIKLSTILNVVEKQLNLSGRRLLQEAINLSLLPHNFEGDFGYPITGMSVTTKDLSNAGKYLARRGNITSSKFFISPQDQYFRIREEILAMTSTAGQLRNFFGDLLPKEISSDLKDEDVVEINPDMTIEIKNLKYFKDNLANEERHKHDINYIADRTTFVKTALEKFYGNNQLGNQIFNYSSAATFTSKFQRMLESNIAEYKKGPLYIPEGIPKDEISQNTHVNLDCYLSEGYDHIGSVDGCKKVAITSDEIIRKHLNFLDILYFEEHELAPLFDGDQELTDLASNTFYDSRYIEHYKPESIKRNFRYYKHIDNPGRWTWFDQFLAKNFTTVTGLDQNDSVVTTGRIPGTSRFEILVEDVTKARYDEHLLEVSLEPYKLLRNFYRAPIIKSIMLTDKIVDSIVNLEYSATANTFPKVALRKKDINDVSSSNIWEWIDLDISKRNDDSYILLKRNNYESSHYISLQKTVFREYHCNLLPVPSDVDFTTEYYDYVKTVNDFLVDYKEGSCPELVEAWMETKVCQLEMARNKEHATYPVNCPKGFGGN